MAEEEQELGMSDEETIKKLVDAMSSSSTTPEEKQNVYKFLFSVATSEDTTKVGYLRDDKELNEIGLPKYPVRTYKSLALISEKIMNNYYFRDYFNAESEIITSTSLSRGGFLTKLAVVQRKEIADVTKDKPKRDNKGWFKSKKSETSTTEVLE